MSRDNALRGFGDELFHSHVEELSTNSLSISIFFHFSVINTYKSKFHKIYNYGKLHILSFYRLFSSRKSNMLRKAIVYYKKYKFIIHRKP